MASWADILPDNVCGIYAIRHVASGRRYIGSSVNVRKRCRGHWKALQAGVHHSRYLQRAWNKYGEWAFVPELIEQCEYGERVIREQVYLDSTPKRMLLNGTTDASAPGRDERVARLIGLRHKGATYYNTPGHRLALSKAGLKVWAGLDAASRTRWIEAIHQHHGTPGFGAAMASIKRAEWANRDLPTRQAIMARVRTFRRPRTTVEISKWRISMKRAWADPDRRAQWIASLRRGAARRWGHNDA